MKTNLTKKVVMATALAAITATMCFTLVGCDDKNAIPDIEHAIPAQEQVIPAHEHDLPAHTHPEIACKCIIESSYKFGEYAYSTLEKFDSIFMNRQAGTGAEIVASKWLIYEAESLGYKVEVVPFEYAGSTTKYTNVPESSPVTYTAEIVATVVKSQNLIFEKTGSKAGTILIGAHYDSVVAGNGIDDNASSVVTILDVAKYVASNKITDYTVKFILFGAEEVGCKGSNAYVASLTVAQKEDIKLFVNLDSLGAGDFNYVHAAQEDFNEVGKTIQNQLVQFAADNGMQLMKQPGLAPDYNHSKCEKTDHDAIKCDGTSEGHDDSTCEKKYHNADTCTSDKKTLIKWAIEGAPYPASDHKAFEKAEIPFIYFESSNWEIDAFDGDTQTAENGSIWHTSKDSLVWLNTNYPGRVKSHLTVYVTSLVEAIKLVA